MSTGSEGAAPDHRGTGTPRRQVVASYDSYADAERAVDFLSDEGFPVERVAIVGSGLRFVEQVAGRVTNARAALTGAGQGVMLGSSSPSSSASSSPSPRASWACWSTPSWWAPSSGRCSAS